MGLTNLVNFFHSDWTITDPMRPLLKPAKAGGKWADQWWEEQRLAFKSSRAKIADIIKGRIKSFTPGMTTALVTD